MWDYMMTLINMTAWSLYEWSVAFIVQCIEILLLL
jgi:hypothetical protein